MAIKVEKKKKVLGFFFGFLTNKVRVKRKGQRVDSLGDQKVKRLSV
jgi:hypothetical protein